ncbi:MAG: FHA domain-containing protein [Deltaproteobacteria bacterium]|nr:FHA domain-containing protein [Deltaproteobacteria bacterium]
MFSQIDRCLRACVHSAGLLIIGILTPTSLLAAEQVLEQNVLIRESPLAFFGYSFQQTIPLKINETPSLTLIESLLVFSGVLLVMFGLWFLQKPKAGTQFGVGFHLLNLGEQKTLIPLKSEIQTLEFLTQIQTSKKYRLSANLSRVTLTPHKNTFVLEDKNYKNALLINRRRSHRTVLCDNDVLDVGEMILIFRNNVVPAGSIHRPASKDLQLPIVGIIPKGPVQKMTPILTFSGSTQKIPLIRNLITIGSSNSNDIIVKGNEVALKHVKIYKVGPSWKIQNLLTRETTTVNGRRIDQRFLQDGDEVTVGDSTFKFKSGKAQIKHTLKSKTEIAKKI